MPGAHQGSREGGLGIMRVVGKGVGMRLLRTGDNQVPVNNEELVDRRTGGGYQCERGLFIKVYQKVEKKWEAMTDKAYQDRVYDWLAACFPSSVRSDRRERTHRFLEEALELAQANGCDYDEAKALLEYVFARPVGRADLEVGGVMVTLAGLCSASGVRMEDAGERELQRNWDRIELIRRKQAGKPQNSSLPQ